MWSGYVIPLHRPNYIKRIVHRSTKKNYNNSQPHAKTFAFLCENSLVKIRAQHTTHTYNNNTILHNCTINIS